MPAIYFDMDGTIADLYGVDGWLDYLHNEDTTPYEIAKPLCKEMILLKSALEKLKNAGYTLGIISWSAKNGSKEYNRAVKTTKIAWLKKHFNNLFEEIHVVKYGTNKYSVAKEKDGILFDDDENVRKKWRGLGAFDVKNIVNDLFNIIANGLFGIKIKKTPNTKSEKKTIKKTPKTTKPTQNTIAQPVDFNPSQIQSSFRSRIPYSTDYCAYIIECFKNGVLKFLKIGKASDFEGRMHEHLANPKYDINGIRVNKVYDCNSDSEALSLEKHLREYYETIFTLTRNDRFYGGFFKPEDLAAIAA